jgi:hypothetical protein
MRAVLRMTSTHVMDISPRLEETGGNECLTSSEIRLALLYILHRWIHPSLDL